MGGRLCCSPFTRRGAGDPLPGEAGLQWGSCGTAARCSWQPPVPVWGSRHSQAGRGSGHSLGRRKPRVRAGRGRATSPSEGAGTGRGSGRGLGPFPLLQPCRPRGLRGTGTPSPGHSGTLRLLCPAPLLPAVTGTGVGLPSSRCDPWVGTSCPWLDPGGKGAAGPRVGTSRPSTVGCPRLGRAGLLAAPGSGQQQGGEQDAALNGNCRGNLRKENARRDWE